MQGTHNSPGLILLSLEFVFNNIKTESLPWYKLVNYNDVITLDHCKSKKELAIKNKLLMSISSVDKHQYTETYEQIQKSLQKKMVCPNQDSVSNAHYSIWISYAEIYNEKIYDLLFDEKRRTVYN